MNGENVRLESLAILARNAKDDYIILARKAWTKAGEYKKIYGNDDMSGEFFVLFSEIIPVACYTTGEFS